MFLIILLFISSAIIIYTNSLLGIYKDYYINKNPNGSLTYIYIVVWIIWISNIIYFLDLGFNYNILSLSIVNKIIRSTLTYYLGLFVFGMIVVIKR